MEKRVLLIDDEASLRRTVTMGLMQAGYQTEPCENGMKGLQALETYKHKSMPLDCAIIDIRLPDIDGLKLLKVIKFNYPGLPVIVITGHGNEATVEEARNQNADGYLEKPFTMDELASLLDEVKLPEENPEPVQTTREAPVPRQSASAYALVTIDASANLLSVYQKLYFLENVLYCDAVKGEYDLALLLQADSQDRIQEVVEKEIKTVKGVKDVALLDVETPLFGENVIDIIDSVDHALGRDKGDDEVYAAPSPRLRASSYAMFEIEKDKLEAIYPVLHFNDQVVHCDYTNGKYDIVLLMKGTSFNEIGNTIKTKFIPLDGVLRIKEWPIITLFET